MEQKEFDIKKYPKSKNKFQCLGPCYQPSTFVVHPTLLELVTNREQPFCPVNEWMYTDLKTGKQDLKLTDICFNPTESSNIVDKELEINILTPYIDFNIEHFLKIYYDIFSFEDAMDWFEKYKYLPIDTHVRIQKSSLRIFGKKIDIVDQRFIDFFIMLIKKKHIYDIYDVINKYIGYDEKTKELILIEPNHNILKESEYHKERVNYIIEIFLNKDDVYKFVLRYFKYRKDKWDSINDHTETMVIDLIEYIINKIKIMLKK